MATIKPQDSINLSLRADTVVVSDTVKVSVTVNTISTDEKTEETLRSEIKGALARLIPGADWKFHNIDRAEDASGFERVTLTATARVSEKENFKLDDRAKKASVQGLTLSDVTVDATVPVPMLEEAERKLRLEIIGKALKELADINTLTKRDYRLGSINYHNQGDPYARKMAASGTAAYTSNNIQPMVGPLGGGDDDGSLTNAQKVTLTASISFFVTVEN